MQCLLQTDAGMCSAGCKAHGGRVMIIIFAYLIFLSPQMPALHIPAVMPSCLF